ncbi:MAG: dihydroorotase, partial [Gammaproteobacteria bacterium]
LCPGVIDLAADFREPGLEHKATIASESTAAATAGVTAAVLTPQTVPVVDTAAVVELINRRAALAGGIRIYPLGALTAGLAGMRLSEIAALRQAGCIGLSNGRRPLSNLEVMRRAFEYAAGFALPVFIEAEEPSLKNNGVMHEGRISTRLGLPGIPATAETVAVSQCLMLIEQTGVRAHFSRLSCGKSVELIRAARGDGLPVTADVSINNLCLTEIDVDGFNADCHLNPPLRTDSDRDALLTGVRDGTIAAICSDHQPHDEDAKAAPFSETEPGAAGIELLAPLVFNLFEREQLSRAQAVAALSAGPAQVLGVEHGVIAPGRLADLFIFNDTAWTVNRADLSGMGKNTPYHGWEMPGRASHTIINGKLIHAPA